MKTTKANIKIENNQLDIIEVADQNINTIAQFTGTRAAAISKFIKANRLDAIRLAADLSRDAKEERKNFASAISGNANNEYINNLRTKYALAEGVGVIAFWETPYGYTILRLLNSGDFNGELVKDYLISIGGNNHTRWRNTIETIAREIGINPINFEMYKHLLEEMVARLGSLYQLYIDAQPITKLSINETIDGIFGVRMPKTNEKPNSIKRYIITEMQLQMLLNRLLKIRNRIPDEEDNSNEIKILKFKVNGDLLFDFITFIDEINTMRVLDVDFKEDVAAVTVTNLGEYNEWQQLFDFHQKLKQLTDDNK
jgi:hypothetical protein